jgi:hypothetical protein
MLRLSLIALVALIAAPPAAAQRLGTGNPSCYEIHNTAPVTVLTHVIMDSGERSVARVPANGRDRHCLGGQPHADGRITFRIMSTFGMPLFSCQTFIDRPIIVLGGKKADGTWEYDAKCR